MTELTQELASRWQRLWGSLIDALIGVAVIFPVMWFSGVLQQLYRGEVMSLAQRIVWFAFGTVVFIVIQGHLLGKHGQTIGKRVVGTRIVSCEDEQILPFWTVYSLRYFLVSLVYQIPGVGMWLSFIDSLFIFRKDKRCIHDLIAGTKVVKVYQKNSIAAAPVVAASKPAVVAGHMEPPPLQKKENTPAVNDDAFYDEVAKEMQENRLVPGVWTRAFAEADGDENRAKAIYIKLRVTKLSANYRQQKEVTQSEGAISQETSEEDQQAKAFAQWQSEEKDLSPRVDMDGKSELFKAQFELKDQGCKDNSSVISTMIWIVVSIVILAVIVTLTMPE